MTPTQARILAALPACSVTSLARALGVDWSTVDYHVRRLERAGLVHCTKTGRATSITPTPAAGRRANAA